jgi:hypothetical protein
VDFINLVHRRQARTLLILLILNVLSTIYHYGHNIMYLPQYLEPEWITPYNIDVFWFLMTPNGIMGYAFFRKGNIRLAYRHLVIYCVMSLAVLLHYNPTPINPTPWSTLSAEIQFVVWQEAVMAFILWGYAAHLKRQYCRKTWIGPQLHPHGR